MKFDSPYIRDVFLNYRQRYQAYVHPEFVGLFALSVCIARMNLGIPRRGYYYHSPFTIDAIDLNIKLTI